jgi:uncharacterized protein YjiK
MNEMTHNSIQKGIILLAILVVLIYACAPKTDEKNNPRNIIFPYQMIGNIDKAHLNKPLFQPSGICFHSKRGTLFVVGNLGEVCEMKTDGTFIKEKQISSEDFEGITHDPSTGRLYIAVERAEKIIELDPETFDVLREFSIPREFMGETLLKPGRQGIEAITFVPDIDHPQGGTFYVANQSDDLEDTEDISAVFEIEVPLKSTVDTNTSAKILRYFSLGIIDLSGLYFDKATGHLYVISDSTNTIFEFTKTGTLLNGYAFPGKTQEGITVDDEDFMYIAQDEGGIIKLKWIK